MVGDYTAKVYFTEYSTGRNLRNTKPRTMIAKVAEMHALRSAFPEEMAQQYVEEEMGATRRKITSFAEEMQNAAEEARKAATRGAAYALNELREQMRAELRVAMSRPEGVHAKMERMPVSTAREDSVGGGEEGEASLAGTVADGRGRRDSDYETAALPLSDTGP